MGSAKFARANYWCPVFDFSLEFLNRRRFPNFGWNTIHIPSPTKDAVFIPYLTVRMLAVDTRRLLNVYKTSIRRRRCRIDVL